MLLTEKMSRNDKAQDELDFGICNVDKVRKISIFLSNTTEVSANWKLNYVKFPKKQTVSKYTTTQWEEENLTKLDDPEVFGFSATAVSHHSFLSHSHSHFIFLTGSSQGKISPSQKSARRLVCAPSSQGRVRETVSASRDRDHFQSKYLSLPFLSNSSCHLCAAKTKHPLQVKVPFRGGEWTFLRCYSQRTWFLRGESRLRLRRKSAIV